MDMDYIPGVPVKIFQLKGTPYAEICYPYMLLFGALSKFSSYNYVYDTLQMHIILTSNDIFRFTNFSPTLHEYFVETDSANNSLAKF